MLSSPDGRVYSVFSPHNVSVVMRGCIAALSTRQQVEFLEPGVAQSLPIGQQGGQIARRLPGDFIGGGRRGAVGAFGDSQGGAHQRRHPSDGGSSGGSSAASTPAAAGAENTGGIGVERIEFRRDFRRGGLAQAGERAAQRRAFAGGDRKSTRLNS